MHNVQTKYTSSIHICTPMYPLCQYGYLAPQRNKDAITNMNHQKILLASQNYVQHVEKFFGVHVFMQLQKCTHVHVFMQIQKYCCRLGDVDS